MEITQQHPALRQEIIGIFFKIIDEEDSLDPTEEICDDETLERVLESISRSNLPLYGSPSHDQVKELVIDVWYNISKWWRGDY